MAFRLSLPKNQVQIEQPEVVVTHLGFPCVVANSFVGSWLAVRNAQAQDI